MFKVYLSILCTLFSFNSYADNDRIIMTVQESSDQLLLKIQSLPSERLKFAISGESLSISSTGKKKPRHDDLANQGVAITAGYIQFNLNEVGKISTVTLDNYSGRLCPAYESLVSVFHFLKPALEVDTQFIMINKPNLEKCSN